MHFTRGMPAPPLNESHDLNVGSCGIGVDVRTALGSHPNPGRRRRHGDSESLVGGLVFVAFGPEDRASEHEVGGLRDLDVPSIPLDDGHSFAQSLDQPRVIGAREVLLLVRTAQHVRSKDLWRLRGRQARAIHRGFHDFELWTFGRRGSEDACHVIIFLFGLVGGADALERVNHLDGRDDRGVPFRKLHDSIDQLRRRARAGRVVDRNVRVVRRNLFESRLHGFVAMRDATSAERATHEREPVVVPLLELGEGFRVVRTRHDDRAEDEPDRFMLHEELNRALKDGATTQIFIKLRAQPPAFAVSTGKSGRGKDNGELHTGAYGPSECVVRSVACAFVSNTHLASCILVGPWRKAKATVLCGLRRTGCSGSFSKAHGRGTLITMINWIPLVLAFQEPGSKPAEAMKADPPLTQTLDQVSSATGKLATDPTRAVGDIAGAVWKLAVEYGPRILGVVILLVVSFVLARWIRRVVLKTFTRLKVDLTLAKFFANIAKWVFLVFAFLACLGTFGVNITSFAAILGAAGLAVGLALQGNLGNLASGILLLIFRPFKIGDSVIVAGQAGVVDGIDLFTTNLDTGDNKRIIVPNGAIFGGVIENQTHHPIRRISLNVPIAGNAQVERTRETLLAAARRVASTEAGGVFEPAPTAVLADIYPGVLWTVALSAQTAKAASVREALLREVKHAVESAGLAPPPAVTNIVVQSLPKAS